MLVVTQGALALGIVGSDCLFGIEWVLDPFFSIAPISLMICYTVYLLGLTYTGTSHLHTPKSSVDVDLAAFNLCIQIVYNGPCL